MIWFYDVTGVSQQDEDTAGTCMVLINPISMLLLSASNSEKFIKKKSNRFMENISNSDNFYINHCFFHIRSHRFRLKTKHTYGKKYCPIIQFVVYFMKYLNPIVNSKKYQNLAYLNHYHRSSNWTSLHD